MTDITDPLRNGALVDISGDRDERLQRLLQYRREYDIDFFHYAATSAYVVTCGRTVFRCDPEPVFPTEETMASIALLTSSGVAERKLFPQQQSPGMAMGGMGSSDPGIAGALWNNNGELAVSVGPKQMLPYKASV